jgi:hypothetical protein
MARIVSTPTKITVSRAGSQVPYALPNPGQKVELVVGGSNRFLNDVKPAWYSTRNWAYSTLGVLSGSAFSADFTTGGAYVSFGHGGHKAPEMYGFTYFDFTTGKWAPYVNGRDADGLEAPQVSREVLRSSLQDDPTTSPTFDNAQMVGYNQMPPPDHTYMNNFVPPRSKVGGTAIGIRSTHRAITANAVSASRTSKIVLEGPNAGRWSWLSTNRGLNVFPPYYNTEAHTEYDATRNRIYWLANFASTNTLYYLDLNDNTWKGTPCTGANAAGIAYGAPVRGTIMDVERGLLCVWSTSTRNLAYLDLKSATKAWKKATVRGTLPAGDFTTYPNSPGANVFRARMAKYPIADGGDDCWYGLWGRGGPPPGNTNLSLPSQEAHEQFLWKLRIPAVLTDPWIWSQSPIVPGDGTGGIKAGLTIDWKNAQDIHFTRFFYVPWLKCFAWIPRHDTNVELIKPDINI